jgi:hypothetical protein
MWRRERKREKEVGARPDAGWSERGILCSWASSTVYVRPLAVRCWRRASAGSHVLADRPAGVIIKPALSIYQSSLVQGFVISFNPTCFASLLDFQMEEIDGGNGKLASAEVFPVFLSSSPYLLQLRSRSFTPNASNIICSWASMYYIYGTCR